jgi:hypothetical protein
MHHITPTILDSNTELKQKTVRSIIKVQVLIITGHITASHFFKYDICTAVDFTTKKVIPNDRKNQENQQIHHQ